MQKFVCAVVAVVACAGPVSGQACFGVPSGAGLFTWGFSGTDGSTGTGFTVATSTDSYGVELGLRRMETFAQRNDRPVAEVRVSRSYSTGSANVCPFVRLHRSAYTADRHQRTTWTGDAPGERTEHYLEIGDFARSRLPVGVALGREFGAGRNVSATPFAAGGLVFGWETLDPANSDARVERASVGMSAGVGLTLRAHRLVLRSMIQHSAMTHAPLAGGNDFPVLSVHLGLLF